MSFLKAVVYPASACIPRPTTSFPAQHASGQRRASWAVRAGGYDFISRAREQAKETASSEANEYVSDIVEVDRTFELLSWIWSSMTKDNKEQSDSEEDESLVPSFYQRDVTDWPAVTEVAVFGGGCFWCLEACFQLVQGVLKVENGYSGGNSPDPTYFEVCSGDTGHAEVVRVTFDPSQVSYSDLLHMFFMMHDPTTLNRQGDDTGSQYRSIILYQNDQQRELAEQVMIEVGVALPQKIVTELQPAADFYEADDYHQAYYARNPGKGYCRMVVGPKVTNFKMSFQDKLYSYV